MKTSICQYFNAINFRSTATVWVLHKYTWKAYIKGFAMANYLMLEPVILGIFVKAEYGSNIVLLLFSFYCSCLL